MKKIDWEKVKKEALKEAESAENLGELNGVIKKYLGKKGQISLILGKIKDLSYKKRREIGKKANESKLFLEREFEKKRELMNHVRVIEKERRIDVTVSGRKPEMGHLHPLTCVKREMMEIFQTIGFEVVEGPEIETDWYNFDALNMPPYHPARDMWDTFWLSPISRKLLLRTHTSPVQIRYMEKHQPPLRIIVPGKLFRHEATDASHEFQLYHLEGLMVGKEVSVAHFKAIVQEFFKRLLRGKIKIRLRPSYFPFTEPSFEIDTSCVVCNGKGCSVCSQTGWVEMMGAGMVHPNVLKNSGLNPKNWQGFAFGLGVDRLTMMKYGIPEIRLFHSGDLRFLRQF